MPAFNTDTVLAVTSMSAKTAATKRSRGNMLRNLSWISSAMSATPNPLAAMARNTDTAGIRLTAAASP